MFDFIWNLASFVVALGILVTVHEYGHFWVARKNGVKVLRFSVGFGRAIWQKTGKDGTEYVLALIPLGGYVKMLDDRVDDVSEAEKNQTFNSKSVYQRIAIIAAGPLANFAFAILAFYIMFLIGVPSIKPVIGSISEQSIAAKAKLPDNAVIVSVAGETTQNWQDVNLALIGQIGNDSIEVETKSLDATAPKTTLLITDNWVFSPEKTSSLTSLGITPYRPQVYNEIAAVGKDSPAEKSGLQKGDKFKALNGKALTPSWIDFTKQVQMYPNKMITLTVERNGQSLDIAVTPSAIERNGKVIGYLGIAPKSEPWPSEYQIQLEYGPVAALFEGSKRTWNLVKLSFSMIGKLLTGDVSVDNLSGPISIAQGAGNSAGHGVAYFLGFLALISINLGIINLLPLPVLDGGHLLYYVVELITGKPVPEKIQETGFKFGAILLMALMAIALFNDLGRVLG